MTEVAITSAVFGLVSLMASPFLLHSTRFFLLSRARIETQRDARNALSILTRTLRQARASTIVIDQAAGQPVYSRISFTTVDGKVVSYFQNGAQLSQVVNGSAPWSLTDKVRFLSFYFPRSDDMTIVSVSLTVERSTYEKKTKALHVASERVRVMD